MEAFIKEKMDTIYQEFNNSLESVPNLCFLRGMFRDDVNVKQKPKYSEKIVQQLYLLRYMPAYLAEYYMLYLEALQNFIPLNSNDKIKVLSIGAGCGIDYWALHFALRDLIKNDIKEDWQSWFKDHVIYKGVDLEAWSYKDNLSNNSNFNISEGDIAEIEIDELKEYNILFFPKSLCELTDETFTKFKAILEKTNFESSKLIIITSKIKSALEIENKRLDEICKILQNKKIYIWNNVTKLQFHPIKDEETIKDEQQKSSKYPGIRSYCKQFKYPHDWTYLNRLNSQCKKSHCTSKCKSCDNDLNRSPVLNTNYIYGSILTFFENYDKK